MKVCEYLTPGPALHGAAPVGDNDHEGLLLALLVHADKVGEVELHSEAAVGQWPCARSQVLVRSGLSRLFVNERRQGILCARDERKSAQARAHETTRRAVYLPQARLRPAPRESKASFACSP